MKRLLSSQYMGLGHESVFELEDVISNTILVSPYGPQAKIALVPNQKFGFFLLSIWGWAMSPFLS